MGNMVVNVYVIVKFNYDRLRIDKNTKPYEIFENLKNNKNNLL